MPGDPSQPSFDFGPPPGDGPSPGDATVAPAPTAAGIDRAVGAPEATGPAETPPPPVPSSGRVVRVRPDLPAVTRQFDYTVPHGDHDDVRVGTVVRVALNGRRVGGWVVADGVEPPDDVVVQPLAKVTGWGPPPEVFSLADWAAWRWAGRPVALLRTASPDTAVRVLPRPPVGRAAPATTVARGDLAALAAEALGQPAAVVRLAPADDPFALVLAAAATGAALVVVPSVRAARHLALRLRRAGVAVALHPRDWAAARAGGVTVVGTRAAVWAPLAAPTAIVVLDEHDEALHQEQAPTWHARDVALERARRAGVPCVLVSPCPTLEALDAAPLLTASRAAEREGWPRVDVVDTRPLSPNEARYSPRLVDVLRSGARVLCVLNRKGRARLLSCVACGEVATCEWCDATVTQHDDGTLHCARCGAARPQVCTRCGGLRMKNLRAGVSRAREELAALARRPVVELTADADLGAGGSGADVIVGTEAALHHLEQVDVVAFLDLDQELLAPRYRAAEEALALLARAARLVGGRGGEGRLLVQTRRPEHEVVRAALLADPARVASAELARRQLLGFPPVTAMALVSGAAAEAFVPGLAVHPGLVVEGPADGRWMARAPDHQTLCDALAATPRPPGRLRIEVDPLRL